MIGKMMWLFLCSNNNIWYLCKALTKCTRLFCQNHITEFGNMFCTNNTGRFHFGGCPCFYMYFCMYKKNIPNKSLIYRGFCFLYVVPPGIEPGTQGFSVLCSPKHQKLSLLTQPTELWHHTSYWNCIFCCVLTCGLTDGLTQS